MRTPRAQLLGQWGANSWVRAEAKGGGQAHLADQALDGDGGVVALEVLADLVLDLEEALHRLKPRRLGRRHRLAEVEALAALALVGDGGLDLQLLVRGLRVVLLAEVIQDALAFLRGGKVGLRQREGA